MLALLLTACLPTPTSPAGADASSDAATDAPIITPDAAPADTDSDDAGDASDTGPDPEAFQIVASASPLRLGTGGNSPEERALTFANADDCDGEPVLTIGSPPNNDDVVSVRDQGGVLLEVEAPGLSVLTAECGAQRDTLEVIVLPLPSALVPSVMLWSRADLGVEVDAATMEVRSWRNLARDDVRFAEGDDAPPKWSSDREQARLTFRTPGGDERGEAVNGLELQGPGGDATPLVFADRFTAAFVARPFDQQDGKDTLVEGSVPGAEGLAPGEYQVSQLNEPGLSGRVGVRVKPTGADTSALPFERERLVLLGSSLGAPFAVGLSRRAEGTTPSIDLTAYTSSRAAVIEARLAPVRDDAPVFHMERLGTGRAKISSEGEQAAPDAQLDAYDGYVYEVLILEEVLTQAQLDALFEQMTRVDVGF
jgi:hypothetical protein